MATAVAESRTTESLQDEEAAELKEASAAMEAGDQDAADSHNERAERLRERVAGLRDEAGDATDPSDPAAEAADAERRDEEADALPPEDIIVRGVEMQYPDTGGKRPTYATISLTGAKAELVAGTGFKKGTTISGSFVAVVNESGEKDEHDSTTQQVTDCEARYKARVTDLVIDAPEE